MSGRREPLTGYRHICPICGADFQAFGDWRYIKRIKGSWRKIYFCSWTCMRTEEKQEQETEREQSDG